VARLLGMDLVPGVDPSSSIADEVSALERAWRQSYDFFFLHVKATDSAGEDGDEARKAEVIEAFDRELPRILALAPDVILLTGDHSTPGSMAGHSWHPVPFLLFGPRCEPDGLPRFEEGCCRRGAMGSSVPGTSLLRLALANAGKLAKFGA
jgi:2,3-bisphosphoglycerate-independent phosphoglycerate mutase